VTSSFVSAEPILIGGHSVYVKFFAMPRQVDDPRRIEGTFTLVGPEGMLTLDALVGPQGIPGEPSPIIRPEWGSTVTDADDLPDTDILDESDDGRAWYIDGSWHVYSDFDGDYHIIQGSIPGPQGITPDVGMSAEIIEAEDPFVYGTIEVDETGTSTAPHFHFKIPGIPGPEGPASSIELASDYNDDVSAEPGDLLVFGTDDKWHPGSPDLAVPRKYTIPENSFVDYDGNGTGLIATLNIAAQPFDWYPDVLGHMQVTRGLLSSSSPYFDVRIGITGASTGETEAVCGLAPYDPSWALIDATAIATVLPHFSSTANPGRAIAPDSSEGRCFAGDPMTVYVFIRNGGGGIGFGGYNFRKAGAQLRIDVVPAVE
jgi:hypothetical protein